MMIPLLLILALTMPATALAQTGRVAGVVVDRGTSVAVPGAIVLLESGAAGPRTTNTDAKGAFAIENVTPGVYHLSIRANGYLPANTDVTVSATTASLDVQMNPDPHFSEVVSVSPDPRSVFDSYQPTSVLGGQDLLTELQATIGATLSNQPGVAVRSFGPGPARPVIRGFDGDRVLVLKDGARMGDLSSQSADHGVNVNPASASRIEVVRGPATLLYGGNAIGGLVNVVTRSIPTRPMEGSTGSFTFDTASASGEAGGAGEITAGRGALAVHFGGSGRRAGDFSTPDGDVPNSFSRGGFVEGGLSYVTDAGYLGGSFAYDRTHYGIPFVEDGETSIDPRRRVFQVRGERTSLSGPFDSMRASAGVVRYRHDELDGEEVATAFANDTNEFEVKAHHRPAGRLSGTIGVWGLTRDFSAEGEEALAPPVSQTGFAAFLYEEASVSPHVTLQFGARVDRSSFDAGEEFATRDFTNVSGSFGVLLRPSDVTTVAFSVARASRNPALEELYFHGPHPGNNAFENGDDALDSEHATGFDASFRWHGGRAAGEVTYFYNRVDNFIFREFTGGIEDDLPETFFTQADATVTGIESHLDLTLAGGLGVEAGLDYVRGELVDEGQPLPRIPPLRGRVGVRLQRNALQLGVDTTFNADQDRVLNALSDEGEVIGELPTDGYALVKVFAAYSFVTGRATNTVALRIENAADRTYRNHLNYLKDLVPDVGRDIRLTFTIAY
jgi:iron complex outermembrane receptor protein